MTHVTLFCFWASYVTAFGFEFARRRWDNVGTRWGGWAALAAGIIAHTIYLFVRSGQSELPPLLGSPHDWLLVLAWLVVATLLIASRFLPNVSLGAYLLPPTIAIVSVAWFVDAESGTGLPQNYWWIFAHSAFLVLGLVGVLLSFVTSLMYLAQHRRLKSKQPLATGSRLPDLETLSRWNWWCIVIAVPLITVGFAMGGALTIASAESAAAVSLTSLPIVVLTVLWLGMVGLLAWMLARPQAGGTTLALRTAWACGFVLATVLSLTALAGEGGVHGRPAKAAAVIESVTPASDVAVLR